MEELFSQLLKKLAESSNANVIIWGYSVYCVLSNGKLNLRINRSPTQRQIP